MTTFWLAADAAPHQGLPRELPLETPEGLELPLLEALLTLGELKVMPLPVVLVDGSEPLLVVPALLTLGELKVMPLPVVLVEGAEPALETLPERELPVLGGSSEMALLLELTELRELVLGELGRKPLEPPVPPGAEADPGPCPGGLGLKPEVEGPEPPEPELPLPIEPREDAGLAGRLPG